jgi:hypothetical protein
VVIPKIGTGIGKPSERRDAPSAPPRAEIAVVLGGANVVDV